VSFILNKARQWLQWERLKCLKRCLKTCLKRRLCSLWKQLTHVCSVFLGLAPRLPAFHRHSSHFIAFHCGIVLIQCIMNEIRPEHIAHLCIGALFSHIFAHVLHIFSYFTCWQVLASVGKCWQVLATQPSSALHLRLFWVALRNVYASPRPCLTLCMQTGTRSWWMKWLRTTLGLWRRR
jgi:hypothetical protein